MRVWLSMGLGLLACTPNAPQGTEAAVPDSRENAAAPTSAPEPAPQPTPAPPPEPTPEPAPPPAAEPEPAPTPATDIEPFFAAYDDEALSNPDYKMRKAVTRQPRSLVSVERLIGATAYAEADASSGVVAELTRAGITTPAGVTCIWVNPQLDIAWTKGKLRCGDVWLRHPEDGGYALPVYSTVKRDGTTWHRIAATVDGGFAWVATDAPTVPITKPIRDYAAMATRHWSRELFDEPGGTATPIDFRREIAFTVRETKRVDGRLWLRVEARADPCLTELRKELGAGWVPLQTEDGRLNVFYELSC